MWFYSRVQAFFRSAWREYLVVMAYAVGVFAVVAPRGGFPDPDSFYHAKMAMMMLEKGIVRGMPQLPFTSLAEAFADHHFLYHVALVPFVAMFGAHNGVAVATVMFGALAVLALHATIRSFGVRWAPAFTAIALGSGGFVFRMGLAKASAPAVILVMLAMMAFRGEKVRSLFVIAWVYVWTHAGWPLMAVIGGAFVAARSFVEVVEAVRMKEAFSVGFSRVRRSSEVRGLLAVIGGLVAGVVVNPYFPTNLKFYWEQIVQIAVIGHSTEVKVGLEWYAFGPGGLIGGAGATSLAIGVLVVFFGTVLVLRIPARKSAVVPSGRELMDLLAPLLLSCAMLALTMRSRRHLEYYIPFATISIGTLTTWAVSMIDIRAFAAAVSGHILWPRRSVETLVAYCLIALMVVAGRSLHEVYRLNANPISWTAYDGPSEWLSSHDPSAMILTSNWDDFPPLFFNDERLRHIIGLDPMFLFTRDPEKYRVWRSLVDGNEREMGSVVKREFGASYVLVGRKYAEMSAVASADRGLNKVYEDDGFMLYAIR